MATSTKGRRVDEVRGLTFRHGPGEYGKKLCGRWVCCAPKDTGDWFTNWHGDLGSHKVIEHEDGTITVEPSIKITSQFGVWHGFLERGYWREV